MKASVIVAILVVVAILVAAISVDIDRNAQARGIAQARGCELLGSAKGLNSVKFIDCNGQIEIIRVQ